MKQAHNGRIVITDANIIINLIHVDRLDLLGRLTCFDFAVPEHVMKEIIVDSQVTCLNRAIESEYLRTVSMNTPGELEKYAVLSEIMGKGEASCLALAEVHGYLIASDEKKRFLRCAIERLGKGMIINTAGILLLAIKEGILSVAEADEIKQRLEKFKFRMKFSSFGDLV